MSDYICDDREDMDELRKNINSMSDEEFEEYAKELKKSEE